MVTRPTAAPGPSGHPLLGMGPAFRRDLLGTLRAGFDRYGDVVGYRFGPSRGPLRQDAVAVHHPDGVRQVLTDGRGFAHATTAVAVLAEMVGQGLLTSDGERWLRQRRTLQPLFTPRRVTGYAELMAAEATRVVEETALAPASVVDLHQLMQRYTLRVVGRALFGDAVEEAIPDLRRLVPLIGDLTLARALALVRPPLAVPTPRNRRVRKVRAEQIAIVDRILSRRTSRSMVDSDDLVGRLARARDPTTGQPLSSEEIRDQVLVFLLAGHETTAGALTFTLHQLGRHPDLQDRVADGADDACRAAVQEGMRLFPPVHMIERAAVTDASIGGCPVHAGTIVLVSPWITHRHPAIWPDPDEFRPDRFLGQADRPRYAYFPFGGGSRSCIGEHFALLEATVLLRTLLEHYRVRSLDARLPLVPLVTLRPAVPVRATLHPTVTHPRPVG